MNSPDETQTQRAAAAMHELLALGEAEIHPGSLLPQDQVISRVHNRLLSRLEAHGPDSTRQSPNVSAV